MSRSGIRKGRARLHFTFRTIAHHPLTRDGQAAALRRWISWQIGSRLVPGPVAIPFVNSTRLLVGPGMHGATLNVYVGLADFCEMSFLLHFLRPGDLVADVGASVGVYTVLASGAIGCRALAFEPTIRSFQSLKANVHLNGIGDRVACYPTVVGDKVGEVHFTTGLDTLDHVVFSPEEDEGARLVPMTTLDVELVQEPALVKIDVEGFEAAVIEGGRETLRRASLQAMILEIGKGCRRYGLTQAQTFDRALACGFTACRYDPMTRQLSPLASQTWDERGGANHLFVRDLEFCRSRLLSAPAFCVLGREI